MSKHFKIFFRLYFQLLPVIFLSKVSSAGNNHRIVNGKCLIVLTSNYKLGDTGYLTGYWLKEAAVPYKVFTDAGLEVRFASPQGGKAPVDPASFNYLDSTSKYVLTLEEFNSKIENTIPLDSIEADTYDCVFFAGGHGPMWDFPDNTFVQKIIQHVYESGGVVAAVCHGPAALLNVKLSDGKYLVDGKTLTSITNEEEAQFEKEKFLPFLLETELLRRKSKFTKADAWEENVEVSGRLVTGQNPSSAEGVSREVIKLLLEKRTEVDAVAFFITAKNSFIPDAKKEQAEHVEGLVRKWWNSWSSKDSLFLYSTADETFLEFTGNHTGRSQGHQNFKQVVRYVFPLLQIEKIDITNVLVIFHGETAICNYYFFEKGSFAGKEFTESGCATDVFVKKGDGWKLVSHHGTKFNKIIKQE